MTGAHPRTIREVGELDAVFAEPVAVLYKHSPLCGSSAAAARQIRGFMDGHPEVPVYVVDVIRNRSLAREVSGRLGVRHESPQAMVLQGGQLVWSGSHGDVTADQLARSVGTLTTERGGDQ